MNMPLKTVICGTGFGTFYAEAVFRDKKILSSLEL